MRKIYYTQFRYILAGLVIISIILGIPLKTYSQQDEYSAFKNVNWQHGPSLANLANWAEIRLPGGYVFADGKDTQKLMEAMGNPTSGNEVGFLASVDDDWFAVFEFNEVGYIKDDEKNDLNVKAILESIRKGTEKSNKIRRKKGFPGLHIIGWEINPHYNDKTHNLEWAISAKDDNGDLVINHNTRLLGRKGVMSATLIVNPEQLATALPTFHTRLADFTFKSGQKYAEFRKGDKIAKYGLTALIVGGATAVAFQTGLLEHIWKYLVVIFVAIGAFFKRIWERLFGAKTKQLDNE